MPINREQLLSWPFQDIEHTYTPRDTILYALGVGLGADPVDTQQLRFLYEAELQALPTMAVILSYPGFWLKDPKTGADWKKILHGEQNIRLHRPLPAGGTVVGRTRVSEIIDKGPGKGALMLSERQVFDRASGDLLASLSQVTFLRGDGGCGGPSGPAPVPHPIPERAPDGVCDLATLPQAALIYRLSGDYNPLHIDPAVARESGFERPILHGLCSLGVAGHALLRSLCDYRPERFKAMQLRFSAPAYPGETIRTEYWHEGDGVWAFRAIALERQVTIINNGRAEIAAA